MTKAPMRERKIIQKSLIAKCFYTPPLGVKCAKIFEIKYNRSHCKHTQRNNWGYWTEKEKDILKKYICNDCLTSLYKKDKYAFWEKITSERKRNILRTYVNSNCLKNNKKIMECDGNGCEITCLKINDLTTQIPNKKYWLEKQTELKEALSDYETEIELILNQCQELRDLEKHLERLQNSQLEAINITL